MKDRYVHAIEDDSLRQDYQELFKKNEDHSLKTLLLLYKGHYLELLGSVIFFIIKHSPVWILPVATSNIIDAASRPDDNTMHSILVNVAVMSLMVLQNIPTNYVHTWLYAKTIRNVEKDLRSELVKKLQRMSIKYHRETESGRLQSKIMRDVEQVQNLSAQIFITMLSIILNVVVAFGVVIFKDWVVFLFFGLTAPIAVFIMTFFRDRIKGYNRDFRKEMEETSVQVMEMVEMIPVTRAHGLEKEETKKMTTRLVSVAVKGLRLDMVQTYFSSVSWVVFQLFQVLCLGFTGYLAAKKRISIGDVVLYQTYFSSIVSNVSGIISLIPVVAKGLESIESFGVILTSDDVEDDSVKEVVERVDGDIRFENVCFGYDESKPPVLKDINFHIKAGETIAFVGPSGAGKSTILDMVIGFSKPRSGHIYIDGKELDEINLSSYRKHIAVVPQTTILFSGTIRENITYGLDNVSDETMEKIIENSDLIDLVQSLPDGIDTVLSEHGGNLSGGQRQRISIARAFIREPSILILDEATSALDTLSEKQIRRATSKLKKGRTTLIVAHRLSTIRDADRIAVIQDGKVAELGTYDELMAEKGIFYYMKKMQS